MIDRPALLDSDTLSDLSRGHPGISARVSSYLAQHGRLTLSAVTVFERLRGYRSAIRDGRALEPQMRQFELLVASSLVLPVETSVAGVAASIWAHLSAKRRRAIGDILIAATASVHQLPLVTRNRRDFAPMTGAPEVSLTLLDWSR